MCAFTDLDATVFGAFVVVDGNPLAVKFVVGLACKKKVSIMHNVLKE